MYNVQKHSAAFLWYIYIVVLQKRKVLNNSSTTGYRAHLLLIDSINYQWLEHCPWRPHFADRQQMFRMHFAPFFRCCLSKVTDHVVEAGPSEEDVITNDHLNKPPGTYWAVGAHHGRQYVNGRLTHAFTVQHPLPQLLLSPPPPLNPGHWDQHASLPQQDWCVNDKSPEAACTGASRISQGQKCCLIMGTRPAERKCPKTHHAGLVICLIIFQLKTHVETGKKWTQQNYGNDIFLMLIRAHTCAVTSTV